MMMMRILSLQEVDRRLWSRRPDDGLMPRCRERRVSGSMPDQEPSGPAHVGSRTSDEMNKGVVAMQCMSSASSGRE